LDAATCFAPATVVIRLRCTACRAVVVRPACDPHAEQVRARRSRGRHVAIAHTPCRDARMEVVAS
jgi:hypothetical protein